MQFWHLSAFIPNPHLWVILGALRQDLPEIYYAKPATHNSRSKPQVRKIAGTKLTARRVKKFRESHGLSPSEFGKLFRDGETLPNGYTRNYISMLERGVMPMTRRFEQNFYRVRDHLRQHPLANNHNVAIESEIISDFILPHRLHIIPTPRKCKRPRCPVVLRLRKLTVSPAS
jgi:hypothetical protein